MPEDDKLYWQAAIVCSGWWSSHEELRALVPAANILFAQQMLLKRVMKLPSWGPSEVSSSHWPQISLLILYVLWMNNVPLIYALEADWHVLRVGFCDCRCYSFDCPCMLSSSYFSGSVESIFRTRLCGIYPLVAGELGGLGLKTNMLLSASCCDLFLSASHDWFYPISQTQHKIKISIQAYIEALLEANARHMYAISVPKSTAKLKKGPMSNMTRSCMVLLWFCHISLWYFFIHHNWAIESEQHHCTEYWIRRKYFQKFNMNAGLHWLT